LTHYKTSIIYLQFTKKQTSIRGIYIALYERKTKNTYRFSYAQYNDKRINNMREKERKEKKIMSREKES